MRALKIVVVAVLVIALFMAVVNHPAKMAAGTRQVGGAGGGILSGISEYIAGLVGG